MKSFLIRLLSGTLLPILNLAVDIGISRASEKLTNDKKLTPEERELVKATLSQVSTDVGASISEAITSKTQPQS